MNSLVDILVKEWDFCKDVIPKTDRIDTNKVKIIAYFIPYINILNNNFKKKEIESEDNIYKQRINEKDTYYNKINLKSCKDKEKPYFAEMKNLGWVQYENNETNMQLTNRGKNILLAYNKKNNISNNFDKDENRNNNEPVYSVKKTTKQQTIQQSA